ncbi:MAG: hypothetical protein PHE73_08875 [Sulfurovaceae bacterium]|nr:hypothetical protein [Sulfurovaceae bacterium]
MDKDKAQSKKLTREEQRIEDSKHAQDTQDAERMLFLADAKVLLARDADARRKFDYEWMVRDLFRRGYHFSRYQPTTQTVVLASKQSAKIPVNLTAMAMRSIRNEVTSFRPKWECLPRYMNEESKTQARYTGMFLDYEFDRLKLKKKIKETITHGLVTSVGIWRILYDERKKEVAIYLVDPFDWYPDSYAESLDPFEMDHCIMATRRSQDWILHNPEFDEQAKKEVVSSEARLAYSEYKQFMIQAVKNSGQYQTEKNSTNILFEGEFRIFHDDGKHHIRRVIWTEQNTRPLYWEDTDEEDYSFSLYQADINPKEIYGEGWMKHVMPINRVIDMLESSVYDYNHRVAKGRIVVDRDSGVRAIHNTHGEIVSKNKGSEVRAMDMPALPVATQNQIERFGRYFEDISGRHDASLGRVPAGVKAGIGIAELKQADATSQDDLVDNLEDFLADVARKVMRVVAKDYKTYKIIQALGHKEEDEKYFAVVGKGANKKGNKDHQGKVKIGPDWLDLAIIGDDNNIRVTVGSWLGYTKEMMQEKVLKYTQIGLIDQKTALRLLEFGSINEIIQETRKESLMKSRLGQQQQGGHPGEQDQFGLAEVENEMMLEGKPIKPDPHDDHEVHIAVHQDILGQGADDIVGEHIQLHQEYLNQSWGVPQTSQDNTRNQQVQAQQPQSQGQEGQPPMMGQAGQRGQPSGMMAGQAPQIPPMGGAGEGQPPTQ